MSFLLPPPTFTPLRIYSDGAGTQSIAVMVLQAQGRLPRPYDAFVFANVGEDSENPDTLAYRREIVIPFAAVHGLNLIERQKTYKGEPDTVYKAALRDNRSMPIPVKFEGQSGFGNRSCTFDHKIDVVRKHIATETNASHAVVGIGFSVDEGSRIFKKYPGWHDHYWNWDTKTKRWKRGKKIGYWQLYEFPLAELRLTKFDCINLVKQAGLPEPPPSLCKWCPFTPRGVWIERKRTNSPLYQEGIAFEKAVNEKYKRFRAGTHPKASKRVFIHPDGIPLEEVPDQSSLWDNYMDTDASCQEGVCGV